MMRRERITGYVTPSLSDCYNEHAKLASTYDVTVNFYKGNNDKFEKRVSYSKKGRVRECLTFSV